MKALLLAVMVLAAQGLAAGSADVLRGRVVDAATRRPLAEAIVTWNDESLRTGADGSFEIPRRAIRLGIRAYGYARASVTVEDLGKAGGGEVALTPFAPKALYLSSYGITSRALREAALGIAKRTQINALVIDIKGDRGLVAFPSAVPLAVAAGARKGPTIANLKDLTDSLHAQGLYCIARIVVFKDNMLTLARPDLAVKTRTGLIWRDRENLAWTDPFRREVWDYNIELAIEGARGGFDEIQFDYVRFPDSAGLVFSAASTQDSRVAAISSFLGLARKRLAPYNVFVAAAVFGYVFWNSGDTNIGQQLEAMLPNIDYLSPMLYPSSFQFGIPGHRAPVAHPHEVTFDSLARALRRTGMPSVRLRPWLQAFQDYAFDRRAFGAEQIRAEIAAAEHAGTNGWMLWNPRNVYSSEGLEPR